jgi:hypothetical protein
MDGSINQEHGVDHDNQSHMHVQKKFCMEKNLKLDRFDFETFIPN